MSPEVSTMLADPPVPAESGAESPVGPAAPAAAQPVAESAAGEPTDERLGAMDELTREVLRFLRLVRKATSQVPEAKDGVELAAYGLLAHVVCEGPRRTTALAEAVHSDTSTVSRQTAALVRCGLLERRPDPEDGRASLLAATPEGERVFAVKRHARNERVSRLLHAWQVPEVQQLVGLLGRLNSDFEAYPGPDEAAVPPPANGPRP
jgi:DNA-binding MarR family transcriptional regulator